MPDLLTLPHRLNPEKRTCRAIIDTPKNSRNKFKYDPETRLFTLSGLLPEGMMFPFDFGFIPSTMGEDGDPVDILVIMDAPAHAGCLLDVRLLGIINAEQTEGGKTETNDRLIGVATHSYQHQDMKSIDEVSRILLDQVEEFFISYNKQRGRKFKVTGQHGPEEAVALIEKTGRALPGKKGG